MKANIALGELYKAVTGSEISVDPIGNNIEVSGLIGILTDTPPLYKITEDTTSVTANYQVSFNNPELPLYSGSSDVTCKLAGDRLVFMEMYGRPYNLSAQSLMTDWLFGIMLHDHKFYLRLVPFTLDNYYDASKVAWTDTIAVTSDIVVIGSGNYFQGLSPYIPMFEMIDGGLTPDHYFSHSTASFSTTTTTFTGSVSMKRLSYSSKHEGYGYRIVTINPDVTLDNRYNTISTFTYKGAISYPHINSGPALGFDTMSKYDTHWSTGSIGEDSIMIVPSNTNFS